MDKTEEKAIFDKAEEKAREERLFYEKLDLYEKIVGRSAADIVAEILVEAVVNAVLHNRWLDGVEPMISVFSNRIEILSRGTIPPAQTMEGFFLGESVPVNEKLSEIFLQLHISEKSGRGVPKIINAYDKGIYRFGENTISVILPFDKLQVNSQINTQVNDTDFNEESHVDVQVKQRINQILSFCSTPKSMIELKDLLQVKDRRTVQKVISPLVEQGRLAMTIPEKPNSRFQKYVTIK